MLVRCGQQRESWRHESQKAMRTLTTVRPQFEAGLMMLGLAANCVYITLFSWYLGLYVFPLSTLYVLSAMKD